MGTVGDDVAVLEDMVGPDADGVNGNEAGLHGGAIVVGRLVTELALEHVEQRAVLPSALAVGPVGVEVWTHAAEARLEEILARPRVDQVGSGGLLAAMIVLDDGLLDGDRVLAKDGFRANLHEGPRPERDHDGLPSLRGGAKVTSVRASRGSCEITDAGQSWKRPHAPHLPWSSLRVLRPFMQKFTPHYPENPFVTLDVDSLEREKIGKIYKKGGA